MLRAKYCAVENEPGVTHCATNRRMSEGLLSGKYVPARLQGQRCLCDDYDPENVAQRQVKHGAESVTT